MQARRARQTKRLDEVVAIYRDGLGLTEIGGFRDHDGYDGVFLEVPGTGVTSSSPRAADTALRCRIPSRCSLFISATGRRCGRLWRACASSRSGRPTSRIGPSMA
jgi:hypothetical protein